MAADCRSCGAPMRWVETSAGRRMPLDPDPSSAGNVVIEADGKARVLPPVEAARYTGEKFTSHFATCPDAARFRNGGR